MLRRHGRLPREMPPPSPEPPAPPREIHDGVYFMQALIFGILVSFVCVFVSPAFHALFAQTAEPQPAPSHPHSRIPRLAPHETHTAALRDGLPWPDREVALGLEVDWDAWRQRWAQIRAERAAAAANPTPATPAFVIDWKDEMEDDDKMGKEGDDEEDTTLEIDEGSTLLLDYKTDALPTLPDVDKEDGTPSMDYSTHRLVDMETTLEEDKETTMDGSTIEIDGPTPSEDVNPEEEYLQTTEDDHGRSTLSGHDASTVPIDSTISDINIQEETGTVTLKDGVFTVTESPFPSSPDISSSAQPSSGTSGGPFSSTDYGYYTDMKTGSGSSFGSSPGMDETDSSTADFTTSSEDIHASSSLAYTSHVASSTDTPLPPTTTKSRFAGTFKILLPTTSRTIQLWTGTSLMASGQVVPEMVSATSVSISTKKNCLIVITQVGSDELIRLEGGANGEETAVFPIQGILNAEGSCY